MMGFNIKATSITKMLLCDIESHSFPQVFYSIAFKAGDEPTKMPQSRSAVMWHKLLMMRQQAYDIAFLCFTIGFTIRCRIIASFNCYCNVENIEAAVM